MFCALSFGEECFEREVEIIRAVLQNQRRARQKQCTKPMDESSLLLLIFALYFPF